MTPFDWVVVAVSASIVVHLDVKFNNRKITYIYLPIVFAYVFLKTLKVI